MRRGAFLVSAVAATALRPVRLGAQPASAAPAPAPAPSAIAAQVRAEFVHAWEGYKRIAWGRDEMRPVSGTTNDFFVKGATFGLSIVEALDTLYVMGLDDELSAATRWVVDRLDPDVDGDVQMFEAVIRLVGGLI